MKKATIILTILLAGWLGASGQNSRNAVDTAEAVVQRYYDLLNIEGIRRDSILYMETVSYKRSNPSDTAILKRWFLPPNRFRAELWHGDTLLEGCYTDGKGIYKEYHLGVIEGWVTVAQSRYYALEPGYDFRGALYHRQADGTVLTYNGSWNYNGQAVDRVYADTPMQYCRNFLFEKDNGLLFFIEVTNKHSEYTNHQTYDHPDWHAFHEYQPVGNVLLPSVESYQMNNDVVYHFTKYRYIPLKAKTFTEN